MAEKEKNTKEQYRKAREDFDSLKIEEKAFFLVESAFSMLAHGIESFGNLFSEQINKVYENEVDETPPSKPRKPAQKRTSTRSSQSKKKTDE